MWVPEEARRGIRIYGAGVVDGFELPNMGAGN